ncbi:MAG TPA: hypothetical protein VGB18_02900 [Candidatus Thermoplasmatota archaeon]
MTQIVAGLAMVALASALLVADFANRLHRVCALMLGLRAYVHLGQTFGAWIGAESLWASVGAYVLLANPIAWVHFANAYYEEVKLRTRRLRITLAIVVFALLVETAYLVNHAGWSGSTGRIGLLSFWHALGPFSYAIAGLVVAAAQRREVGGPDRGALMVAVAFCIQPVAQGTDHAISIFAPDFSFADPLVVLEKVVRLLGLAMALTAAVVIGRAASDSTSARRAKRIGAAIIVAPALLAILLRTGFQFGHDIPITADVWIVLVALALLVVPVTIGYAAWSFAFLRRERIGTAERRSTLTARQ